MFLKKITHSVTKIITRNMNKLTTIEHEILESTSRSLIPPLSGDFHKGQAGRIAIIGGCFEYTGAPYFAAISGLKVGADLVHIFCTQVAGPVIKSYSPEMIVHPVLDTKDAISEIKAWLDRFHVLVIGPGLGRDPFVLKNVENLINVCRECEKPLIIDADGLYLVAQKPTVIENYPGVILTPNIIEYKRLITSEQNAGTDIFNIFGKNCVIIKKGKTDEIFNYECQSSCLTKGSPRRCGGQGDLLAGCLAVFYNWALQHSASSTYVFSACYAACKLIRKCNLRAFKRFGRSMTVTDMIQEIGSVFSDHFDNI